VVEKMVAAVIPVTVFVALGFEHSVANAFFYLLMPENGFLLVKMLMVCILGNVVGGMLLFGVIQAIASMNWTKNWDLGDKNV
jgi:formate/nitrite transporter FocA (FNT family)